MTVFKYGFILLTTLQLNARAAAQDPMRNLETFRALFYKNAKAQGMEDADIRKLIFKPQPDFFQFPTAGKSAEDLLRERQGQLKDLLPSSLYKAGFTLPAPVERPGTGPVTIVIIPGIFGEFIDHSVYEEFFLDHKDSDYAQAWKRSDPAFDPVFDLESLSEKPQKIQDLIQTASFDDESGHADVKVVLLKAPKSSFETLGTLAESAEIYQRRLDLFFKLMPEAGDIYFLGYSRGLNVGMEILAGSSPDTHRWMKNVRGLIGLGGTTYGSYVADMALDVGTIPGQILEEMRRLADELEIPENLDVGLGLRNSKRWLDALARIRELQSKMGANEGIALEKIKSDNPDLGFFLHSFQQIALEEFQLDRPVSQYGQNIRRFKTFVREAREGLETLTSKNCLEWIRQHQLPETYRYYAITTVMPDPTTAGSQPSELLGNPLAYQPDGIDYSVLRSSFYSFLDYSGLKVNDSQISLDRSPFWPALQEKANPAQKPFEAQLLAILGTDHWGMAFPVAFEVDTQKVNPFPRTVLLKTLGDYLKGEP